MPPSRTLPALALTAVLALSTPFAGDAQQPSKPRPQQRPTQRQPQASPTPSPSTTIQKSGISVNRTTLQPGIDLPTLLGIVGPPDHVDAVRGKEPENDYVRFTYNTYGFCAHVKTVNNQDNIIESMVILQSSVKLVNVPFKVGDSYQAVMQAWGQPDQQEPGFLAYWKRGVYMAVDDKGTITGITLAEPGKVEETPPTSGG